MFSRIEFILTETFLGLRRHMVMAIAAIACVMAALFIAGMVGLAILNAQQLVISAKERVRFVVYFTTATTREDAQDAFSRITHMPGVDAGGTEFVPKEKGFEKYKANQKNLAALLGRNPLPDSVNVKPERVEDIPALERQIKQLDHVDTFSDAPNVSDFLTRANEVVLRVGLIFGIVLAFLSLVIIHHTIELTIFARRKEIRIMSLVGATPLTIGVPFLLEGIIYGLIGGGIAFGLLAVSYGYASTLALQSYQTHLLQDPLLRTDGAGALLIAGMALGFFGSMGSVVKYLHRPKSRLTNA